MATELCTEMYLSFRLSQEGASMKFRGIDRDERREMMRKAIREHGLQDAVIGQVLNDGFLTFADYFQRVYGMPWNSDER